MKSLNRQAILLLLFVIIAISNALECYVCKDQENNDEKCIKTIKTCEQDEDVCLTEISWGSTPYWSQGALKQYYISKKCSSKAKCVRSRQRTMPFCTHIWYEDWSCSECCQGDRCNYFIISKSPTTKHSILTYLIPLFGLFICKNNIIYS